MNIEQIQYVSNTQGKPTAVIVPIELWQEMISKQETADLLKSDEKFKTTSIKALLLSMPNVGEDEDFARHQDLGRECDALFD